ncbi:hypothetical protein N9H39_07770 [Gammaproteobacteria bacterium]|nr:hypothetical protein [Gammaproteobacteria bacterium]
MNRIKILIASSLLLLTSQAAVAQIVITSAVTDPPGDQIVVKGSGFILIDPLTVSLGGVAIPVADFHVVSDGEMTLDFSSATATAVPEQGSYLLQVTDGVTPDEFSIYFDAPIIPPVTSAGACPCQGIWDSYGARGGKRGFADLAPSCTFGLLGSEQVAVQFYDSKFSNLWVLTSEYADPGDQDCALEFDEPNVLLSSPEEHNACSTYLTTNYFGTGAPECASFPPLLPPGF